MIELKQVTKQYGQAMNRSYRSITSPEEFDSPGLVLLTELSGSAGVDLLKK